MSLLRGICSIVNDSCKVNKGLAAVISTKLGLEWVPGQLYFLIHSVIGFLEGICGVWLQYQEEMGHDKLEPSVTRFELDVEEKGPNKQITEMFLRPTADRWQARSWNRFEEYSIFCMERGTRNLGQELHGNRFAIGEHLVVNFEDEWYVDKMRTLFWSVPAVWFLAPFLM